MIATILDTQTGETRIVDGPCSFEWAENNYSCDCNRENKFDHEDEDEDEETGLCKGGKRYLVIKAEFQGPEDYGYTLEEFNNGYPEELLRKHGIIK